MKKKVFISILTILISIPLFMDTPLANTTNIQTTNHGTITYDVSGDSNESDQMGITLGPLTFNVAGKKVSTFTYELDNVYTGTIVMQGMGPYFSGGHGTQYNCELYMTNCTVADRSDDKITFYIKEQSSFSVSLVRDNDGTMQYNDWYQIYSETLTAAGTELNTLNAIYVYVHSLSDDVLDIKQSVVNNLPDIYDALGYDVDNTSSTMRTDLQTLKTLIQGIGTQIGTFSGTTLAGTMTSMQSYLIAVDQKLDYIKTKTDSIISAINTLHLDMQSLISSINSIKDYILDDSIDDISVETLNAYMYFKTIGTFNTTRREYFIEQTTNAGYDENKDFQMNDVRSGEAGLDHNYYLVYYSNANTSPTISTYSGRTYIYSNRRILYTHDLKLYVMKIDLGNYASDYVSINWDRNLYIKPIFMGFGYNMPYNVSQLIGNDGNDIYIRELQKVIDAINDMSLNVNQMTVNATGITYNVNNTQVNNSVNTYNTDIQNVYNVENDFSSSFNTYNQQFTPDFTETMTTIQSVPVVMNDVIADLYNLQFIKYPLLLTLAGIVLIALLGV